MFAFASLLWAQMPSPLADPHAFGSAVLATVIFGVVGIALAILGFKLFDLLTHGNLEIEVIQKQNVAAAILGAAIILGICLIVSHAMS